MGGMLVDDHQSILRFGDDVSGCHLSARDTKRKIADGLDRRFGPGLRDETGRRIPPDVKTGDAILFGKWSGTEIRIDGEVLLIMKEADVMGIVEKAAPAVKAG